MPNAEQNTDAPSQSYGEKTQRDAYIAGTGGQGAAPPLAAPPPSLPPFQEPDFGGKETDELVPGAGLAPDEMELLMSAQAQADDEEVASVATWLPVLQFIAQQPGSTQSIRALADEVRRRSES